MLKKQTLSTERVDPWPNPRESPKEKAHIQAHKSQTIWNHQGKNMPCLHYTLYVTCNDQYAICDM